MMQTTVTEQGLLIPKKWLEGVDEVEIQTEKNFILIVPIIGDDPIFQLGIQPIVDDIEDASIYHDHYLYNS